MDKTGLIACTNERVNTSEKYICVSRPRRFSHRSEYRIIRELPTGRGFADVVFLKPHSCVIEKMAYGA